MSNNISNRLLVWGPLAEVDRFVGAFLRDGFNAHVPIPADAEPTNLCEPGYRSRQLGIERWGTRFIYPGITFRTQSHVGVAFNRKYPEATERDGPYKLGIAARDLHGEEVLGQIAAEGYQGYIPPYPEDAIALLGFDTPSDPPCDWIVSVVESLYESGVKFVLEWWDEDDRAQCAECGYVLRVRVGAFWTFQSSEGNTFKKAALRADALVKYCVAWSGSDECNCGGDGPGDGDGGGDLYLPEVNDEGNQIIAESSQGLGMIA